MHTQTKAVERTALPVVLVTGCGSGIGLALARQLYHLKRHRVVATVRTAESQRALQTELPHSAQFRIEQLDVTDATQRERLVRQIYQEWRSIDVLVNNAGISYRSVIEHMDDESEMRQLNVNYLSPMALIRLVIPSMRERGSGHIINVSSVSGIVSMPTMASYSASKHALDGATESLWYELRPYGISVSLIQPGFVHSDSYQHVQFSHKANLSRDLDGPYSEYYTNMGRLVERLMRRSLTSPERIARRIVSLIDRPSRSLWVPVTPDARIFYLLRALLPRPWFHRLIFRLLPAVHSWGRRGRAA